MNTKSSECYFTAKYMDMEPQWVAINSSHVFAASRDNFLLWHYITPKTHSTLGNAGSLSSIMEKILLNASLNIKTRLEKVLFLIVYLFPCQILLKGVIISLSQMLFPF